MQKTSLFGAFLFVHILYYVVCRRFITVARARVIEKRGTNVPRFSIVHILYVVRRRLTTLA